MNIRMRQLKAARVVLAVVLIGCGTSIFTSTSAAALNAWSTPADVSTVGSDSAEQQVEIDPNGTIIAVWKHSAGTDVVEASTSGDHGTTWSVPTVISTVGVDSAQPQLAISAAGVITAVWRSGSPGAYTVEASTSTNGGSTWGAPVSVSPASAYIANNPQLAIDAVGTITVVWAQALIATPGAVVTSSSTDAGSTWNGPTTLSATGASDTSERPQVVVTTSGNVVVAWSYDDGAARVIQTAELPSGGAWSAPSSVSVGPGPAVDPQLVTTTGGRIIAIWINNGVIEAVIFGSPTVALSNPAGFAESPQVAALPNGAVLAIWADTTGTVYASTLTAAASTWTTPVALSAPGAAASSPQIATGSSGDATVVWSYSDTSLDQIIIQAATSADAGSTWGTAITLSLAEGGHYAQAPQVAIRDAVTVATWARLDPDDLIVQAATFVRSSSASSASTPGLAATGADLRLIPAGAILIFLGLGLLFSSRIRRFVHT